MSKKGNKVEQIQKAEALMDKKSLQERLDRYNKSMAQITEQMQKLNNEYSQLAQIKNVTAGAIAELKSLLDKFNAEAN